MNNNNDPTINFIFEISPTTKTENDNSNTSYNPTSTLAPQSMTIAIITKNGGVCLSVTTDLHTNSINT